MGYYQTQGGNVCINCATQLGFANTAQCIKPQQQMQMQPSAFDNQFTDVSAGAFAVQNSNFSGGMQSNVPTQNNNPFGAVQNGGQMAQNNGFGEMPQNNSFGAMPQDNGFGNMQQGGFGNNTNFSGGNNMMPQNDFGNQGAYGGTMGTNNFGGTGNGMSDMLPNNPFGGQTMPNTTNVNQDNSAMNNMGTAQATAPLTGADAVQASNPFAASLANNQGQTQDNLGGTYLMDASNSMQDNSYKKENLVFSVGKKPEIGAEKKAKKAAKKKKGGFLPVLIILVLVIVAVVLGYMALTKSKNTTDTAYDSMVVTDVAGNTVTDESGNVVTTLIPKETVESGSDVSDSVADNTTSGNVSETEITDVSDITSGVESITEPGIDESNTNETTDNTVAVEPTITIKPEKVEETPAGTNGAYNIMLESDYGEITGIGLAINAWDANDAEIPDFEQAVFIFTPDMLKVENNQVYVELASVFSDEPVALAQFSVYRVEFADGTVIGTDSYNPFTVLVSYTL